MKTEKRPFLEAGIKHYGDACRTIHAFQEQMEDVLERAVTSRTNWHPLQAHRLRPVEFSRVDSRYGHWISIAIIGKPARGPRAVIDCGFWWESGYVTEPIIYTGYYLEPKDVTGFRWSGRKSDIRSISVEGRTYLYLPLQRVEEIQGSVDRLLGALLKQLK